MSLKGSVVVDRLDRVISLLGGKTERFTNLVPWTGENSNTPNSDRTINTTRSRVGITGSMINLNCRFLGSPTSGRLYVRVFLEDSNSKIKGSICSGYLWSGESVGGNGSMLVKEDDRIRIDTYSSMSGLTVLTDANILRNVFNAGGWSGKSQSADQGSGYVYNFSIANPAKGSNFSQQVGSGASWEFRSVRIGKLTTNSTVASRHIRLNYTAGSGNTVWRTSTVTPSPANTDYSTVFGIGANEIPPSGASSTTGDFNVNFGGNELIMDPSSTILSQVTGFQTDPSTGDQLEDIEMSVIEHLTLT